MSCEVHPEMERSAPTGVLSRTEWNVWEGLEKLLLITFIVAPAATFTGILFHWSIITADDLFQRYPWLIFLLPFSGLFLVWIYRIFHVDLFLDSRPVYEVVKNGQRMYTRQGPLVFISSTITHLFGGSAGSEGSSFLIGGSVAWRLGGFLHLDVYFMRLAVLCGMVAAFTPQLGTPITAAVFVLEMTRSHRIFTVLGCFMSSLSSWMFCSMLHLDAVHFTLSAVPETTVPIFLGTVVLGFLCILIGKTYYVCLKIAPELFKKTGLGARLIIFMGGVVMAGYVLCTGTVDYCGSGIQVIGYALHGYAFQEAFFWKILLTTVTLGVGFKGGQIIPAFFIGATFGSTVFGIFGLDSGLGAALGLVSVFSCVMSCPISALVLGMEMFTGAPLELLVTVCATGFFLERIIKDKLVFLLNPVRMNMNPIK